MPDRATSPMTSELSPILLFAYNRPEHTLALLESLTACDLSDKSSLIIYADGPKDHASAETIRQIHATREILHRKKWCGEVTVIERETNFGLAANIMDGVTSVINRHGRVIVLEDDLILSRGFLRYMNDALRLYEHDERVMHVSGYMFPVSNAARLPETFFFNTASCWGWGTWARAWKMIERDPAVLVRHPKITENIKKFNIDGTYDYYGMLSRQATGQIDSWAILWYSTIFLHDGFSLHPRHSLTNNRGHDGSGVHSYRTNQFTVLNMADEIKVEPIPFVEHPEARKLVADFYARQSLSWKQRIKQAIPPEIASYVGRLIPGQRRAEALELSRISQMPRFTPGLAKLRGMEIEFVDSASFVFMFKEIFQRRLYAFRSGRTNPFIIDCGANIGLSVLFYKSVFPDAEILAFEPDETVHRMLLKNIERQGHKGVTVIRKGVWSDDTVLQFRSDGADGGRIDTTAKAGPIRIETTRLSAYMDREVDFLKIDIEGAELEVLKEIRDQLFHVNNLFIEYHSFAGQPQKLDELLQIITASGFRYYVENNGVNSSHPFLRINTYMRMDLQLNIFAYRG